MVNLPDKQSIASAIQQNRAYFISYNIAHLRELIRYLSAEKFELFHTLPFLLHVNSPKFPGYVSDPALPLRHLWFSRLRFLETGAPDILHTMKKN